jgi:ABC-2 type transport system ATP-binding protein
MDAALALDGVVKDFGATRAVDGLDLRVAAGETCGVVGPSGAGKTTTIRMILSILFPDSGSLRVLGRSSALEAKDRIGYLPEERGVYRRMRVGEFLQFIAGLKGVGVEQARRRAAWLMERLGLDDDVTGRRCEDLSKGMLQRVQFVAATINSPQLLILDEPFSGLDPVSVRRMKEVIAAERAHGTTILFSTHVMAQAEELCDRVVMIHRGAKVLDEPTATLRRQFDRRRLVFEPLDPDADLQSLAVAPGVEAVQAVAGGCELGLREDADPAEVIRAVAVRVPPARIELARIRLEDVFVRLVTGGGAAAEGEAAQALRTELAGEAAREAVS